VRFRVVPGLRLDLVEPGQEAVDAVLALKQAGDAADGDGAGTVAEPQAIYERLEGPKGPIQCRGLRISSAIEATPDIPARWMA
jgi:hypothetical protein